MRSLVLLLLGVVLSLAQWGAAQAIAQTQPTGGAAGEGKALGKSQTHVVVIENIKLDYAQVLYVEPVYQTLHASRTEQQCIDSGPPDSQSPVDSGRMTRMMDSVKGLFGNHSSAGSEGAPPPPPSDCRIVKVPREFRRPIAYDVDYVYKGTKYRSRLPEDPGNRLQIRVSVTPYIPDAIVETVR